MLIHSDISSGDKEIKADELENEDEKCLVCHDNLDNKQNNVIKLNCGHKYHYKCIFMTYKHHKVPRQCPYCRGYGGYLELKDGMIPIRGIHREFNDYLNGNLSSVKLIEGKCKQIVKTGKNKGFQCKNKHKPGQDYCGIHLKNN